VPDPVDGTGTMLSVREGEMKAPSSMLCGFTRP
jgi:hypothetical protein